MKQFAPAAAHAPIVSGVALMPPSTCVEINRYHHAIEQAFDFHTAGDLDVHIQVPVDDPLADLLLCGNQNFTARSC